MGAHLIYDGKIRSNFVTTISIWIFLLNQLCSSYLIIVNESSPLNSIIFNASVYKLGSERYYKINSHRSAQYVHHLLDVDHRTGQVKLKTKISCSGLFYPTMFTFYIDSFSSRLRSIDYYSLPIRILVNGKGCNDDNYSINEFFHGASLQQSVQEEKSSFKPDNKLKRQSFSDGDILFGNPGDNLLRQNIINRKRRALIENSNVYNLTAAIDDDIKIHTRIQEARQWISETYASYAIQTTDQWNKICLKKSQFINSLNAFLPKTISAYCRVTFLDINDKRFKIESHNQDLVASISTCIEEPMWKVIILFRYNCDLKSLVDAEHRLKIVYHHQELNDTDIARRVKRELRNQSPYFEQALYAATVLEEQPPSTSVITVRARDPEDSPVLYSMTSLANSRSQGMFKIDSHTGIVTTSIALDRELMDTHYFKVIATDDSFPPRSGTTTLQIHVIDCNDHAPTFESEQFDASIREGISVGSAVLTLHATDQDKGKNAEIDYSIVSINGGGLTTPEEDERTFQIDSKTGVIQTRSNLDREKTEIYTIIVKASDMASPQSERKSSSATIIIKILDDNDNYPQFSERAYTVSINEENYSDKLIIANIMASDADEGNNAAIRYAIIGGNIHSQFTIDSLSGKVSLSKPLDYENMKNYRLVIRAQDGGTPSKSNTTQLLVNVLDANDNAPRFYASQFQEAVLENVEIGFNILRLQAYDADEGKNAEIYYAIADDSKKLLLPMSVDSRTGWIQTTRILDREEQSRYVFQVVAIDAGIPPKSASASVVITIQDINDNDPIFSPSYYEVNIAEDQIPGTPITTVIASDADEDSRLHYEITSGNTRGRFSITSQNGRGLITIAQPLDYKQERRYLLIITATDSGGRSAAATVNINITDANNYAPIFENAPYSTTVFEDAPIGTTVIIVSATDSDVGINALITYALSDESANSVGTVGVFAINGQTGAIYTIANLDREMTPVYMITVTANDGGNPSLSDTTDVEISITDVNDNPPVFKIPLYKTSISEDAIIGSSVLQLSATDKDTGINSRIKYAFSDKDSDDGSFVIDPTSGIIRTNKVLDREMVAIYHLVAYAIDRGTPSMSSSVEVHVRLEDINDSPPTFESDKLLFYVSENSPIGSVVGEIHAHDADEGVNAIIQYSIIGGEDINSFSLVTRPGSERAQLLTMVELDYESSHKKYEIIVRAASPPLRSDVHVEILVTDVNDNAPILKDFQVIFNNFQDCFPAGAIGSVPAFDADVTDQLSYRILSGNNANFVRLNSSTGSLILSPQLNTNVPRFATMEVAVTDGINEAKAIMQLFVRLINDNMLYNSVTVRLNEMSKEAFLSPLMSFFIDGLAAIIPCPKENIYIFSIQDDSNENSRILNVSFSAKRLDTIAAISSDEQYYSSEYLRERVYLNRAILARIATVQVLPFDDNICVHEPCLNFEQCLNVLKFGNASDFIHSDTVLFRPIYPVNTFACKCPIGFTGSREHYLCDTEIDLCYSNPCLNDGKCVRREGGFTCACKSGYTGNSCDTLISFKEPCNNNNLLCDGSAGLACTQHSISVTNLDLVNKLGGSNLSIYTATCELRTRSFKKNSFLTFESMKQRHRFNIKLRFATINEDGLLLYNGRYNELHDFISLELISGEIQFAFSLGDKEQSVRIYQAKNRKLSDGEWHSVNIDYFNRTAIISVDNCDTALALSGATVISTQQTCANKTTIVLNNKCSSLTETCHRFLDLTGPLQIGGLPFIPGGNFRTRSHYFVGCISDLMIDNKLIDLNIFIANNGSEDGCTHKSQNCLSEPCFNGAICKEGWEKHSCECVEGYTGYACQESLTSQTWRFKGDGLLSFNPLLRAIQMPWSTAFSLRTRAETVFILQIQIGQNSSVVICLEGGFLLYMYNNEQVIVSDIYLADGRWHRIEIKWTSTELLIFLNYGQRIKNMPMSQKIQGLYVGKIIIGIPDTSYQDLSKFVYFEGCIKDVRIGGTMAILNRPTVRENVSDNCDSHAKCSDSITCPIHSNCEIEWDRSYCTCLPGYVGSDCVPICTLQPCSNGICRLDMTDSKGYVCECDVSISSGEHCEIPIEQPCPGGWWGERGCGPCNCDINQGYHLDCHKITGECYCKEQHYQPINETRCLPCDCYIVGSYGSTCNLLSGQCECRDGVIGRRCDSCSNPYAEVTLSGCEVVYDACPKSFSNGIWWPRTSFGQLSVEKCPSPAKGNATRICGSETVNGNGLGSGSWQSADMFNCTSEPFVGLGKQLAQLEMGELELNSFIAIRTAESMQQACEYIESFDRYKMRTNAWEFEPTKLSNRFERPQPSTLSYGSDAVWAENLEIQFLLDDYRFVNDRLYGNDILIIEGILHELIEHELRQNGLNLTHSQDKYFVKNVIHCASTILDGKYTSEWKRIMRIAGRGPIDLVDAFHRYQMVVAHAQHDTFTNPFEVTQKNMVFGLDVVTYESLFGYEMRNQINDETFQQIYSTTTTENFMLTDDDAFMQYTPRQSPKVTIPKYNNYLQDKLKFDIYTKVFIPLSIIGMYNNDDKLRSEEFSKLSTPAHHRAIISYVQYKYAGILFGDSYDDTITRRWGVDIKVATPVLSLVLLVPSNLVTETANTFSSSHFPSGSLNGKLTSYNLSNSLNNSNISDEAKSDDVEVHKMINILAHDSSNLDIVQFDHDESIFAENVSPNIDLMSHEYYDLQQKLSGRVLVAGKDIIVKMSDQSVEMSGKHLKRRHTIGSAGDTHSENSFDLNSDNSLSERISYRSLNEAPISQPIKLQMWVMIDRNRFGSRSNPQCVRWNQATSSWTRLGCQTQLINYDNMEQSYTDPDRQIYVNCSCTQISHFAVLIDAINAEDIPAPSLLTQIVTYSAFAISLPILLSVLIALALLRGMQTNSNTIHQNLVLCLFLAELLYFIGQQSRRNLINAEFSCKMIAICLHYFWVAAFAWTTVDCIHLYRMLTEMRDINHGPMGFYFSLSYGAPAVIVGLSVGVRAHEYGNNLFCWLSIYESVVWWLIGPIVFMSFLNLVTLFMSVKAAFTLKDDVLGFGNLRTLLWLTVVALPLIGLMWVLALLTTSQTSQLLSLLLSIIVVFHALFCLFGYCIINNRVRDNLKYSFLRCIGRKVPLLDSSLGNSSQNITGVVRSPVSFNKNSGSIYDSASRRNISASSTTSRSTTKTGSSPYRSDGQLRHTSTSTSNYNSDATSYIRSASGVDHGTSGLYTHRNAGITIDKPKNKRRNSDSGSETDGPSLDLASSHSSDEDESRLGSTIDSKIHNHNNAHRTTASIMPTYLPNITEHVQATTPPELNIVQSPQLFPNVKSVFGSRWSSQLPETFLSSRNEGRWSQDTGSDNEVVQTHNSNSPNPLPNPDITDHNPYSVDHNNVDIDNDCQNLYMIRPDLTESIYDNNQYRICNANDENVYGLRNDTQDNYQSFTLPINRHQQYSCDRKYVSNFNTLDHPGTDYQTHDVPDKHIIHSMNLSRASPHHLLNEKKEHQLHFTTTNPNIRSPNSSLQQRHYLHRNIDSHNIASDVQSDRISETSDKNCYTFPYTAEEDHLRPLSRTQQVMSNSPFSGSRLSSRHTSRSQSPCHTLPLASGSQFEFPPLVQLNAIDNAKPSEVADEETTV